MTLQNDDSDVLDDLVSSLPELYQPIFGHPKYGGESRPTEDRVVTIKQVVNDLSVLLGRPLRILDLGCAQAFVSFSLAAVGATVVGIDSQIDNIRLCNELACHNTGLQVNFQHEKIELFIPKLVGDEFDLVIGLSVFHHIAHEHGLEAAQTLIKILSERIAVGIYELAVKSEPLYWAESLPVDEEMFLGSYSFVHKIAAHQTHLSEHKRPLLFASKLHWWFEGSCETFTDWKSHPHAVAGNVNQNTRRYFFSRDKIAKRFRLIGGRADINKAELQQEGDVLLKTSGFCGQVNLTTYQYNESETWLVRDLIEGQLLLDILPNITSSQADRVILNVLGQLVYLQDLGLYHNDVSVWNVIVRPNGEAVLIDYGAITSQPVNCVWPKDLFHAFIQFVFTILTPYPPRVLPVRRPYISATNLPDRYRHWITTYLQKNAGWQPKLLLQLFPLVLEHAPDDSAPVNGNDAWRASVEQHLDILGDNIVAIQTNQSEILQLIQKQADLQHDLDSKLKLIQLAIGRAEQQVNDEVSKP
jgi:O-antigen chain-terminating bifunctional methyltransferase/kinase